MNRIEIPQELITNLCAKAMTYREMAAATGVSIGTIQNRIKELQEKEDKVLDWKKLKQVKLESLQMMALDVIEEQLPAADLDNAVKALKVIHSMSITEKAPDKVQGLLGYLMALEENTIDVEHTVIESNNT